MSNNPDPQILAQLMALYQSGQIKLPNQDQTQGQNINMNQFNNNNNGTVFIPNNQNQNQYPVGFNQNPFGFNPMMYGNMNVNNVNPGFNIDFNIQNQNNMQNNVQNQEQGWTLIFETKPDNSRLEIQIGSSEILSSAFAKYRTKAMKNNIPLTFKYKDKPLDPKTTVSGSGLNDKAVIVVEVEQSNPPQNNDPNQMNLFFENRGDKQVINIQIQPDKYVRDAILAYKNKVNKDENMIFIFNSKTLDENMSLKQAGLNTGARILVVETSGLVGA
jgi:hypothetical protein